MKYMLHSFDFLVPRPANIQSYSNNLYFWKTYILTLTKAQRPPHECKFDFFLLHCVTASVGHSLFLEEKSISRAQKARILEYTGRVFMMTYAGMGAADLNLDWLVSHPPKLPNQGWPEIFERACYHEDDGHLCKLIRCTAWAQRVSEPYDHLPEFKVKQHMFLAAGNAMIDSGSKQPMDWTKHFDLIRGAGFPEPWEKVPLRSDRAAA